MMRSFVADPAELLAAWCAMEDCSRQVVAPFIITGVGRARLTSAGTTKQEVLTLADWLRCLQVPAVGAGGGYWNGPMVRSPVCGSYRAI